MYDASHGLNRDLSTAIEVIEGYGSLILRQTTASQMPIDSQFNHADDRDPFWSLNGIADHQADVFDNVMDLDFDLLLNPIRTAADSAAQPVISWEQWDAWLTDSFLHSLPWHSKLRRYSGHVQESVTKSTSAFILTAASACRRV